MIELFGSNEAVLKDYIRHDRLSSFIDQKCENEIYGKSLDNSKSAWLWSKKQGLNKSNIKHFVSKYCEIVDSDSLDTNAYSDIRFPSNIINLYKCRINELYYSMNDSTILNRRLGEVFILHEFYHYIEHHANVVLESVNVNTFGFWKWKLSANVDAVSEISATFFVREVVGDVREFLENMESE